MALAVGSIGAVQPPLDKAIGREFPPREMMAGAAKLP